MAHIIATLSTWCMGLCLSLIGSGFVFEFHNVSHNVNYHDPIAWFIISFVVFAIAAYQSEKND